jgi:hypothetical protein
MRNVHIPLLELFPWLDYQIVAILVACKLRNCAVPLELLNQGL